MGTTKDIRDAVEAELEFDPLVDDADIHVVGLTVNYHSSFISSSATIAPDDGTTGAIAFPFAVARGGLE